jgi:serine/threonine protein kinase
MEYMAAGSLLRIIEDYGLINETASIKYIDQILDGLVYIHSLGIVHSDLKCKDMRIFLFLGSEVTILQN